MHSPNETHPASVVPSSPARRTAAGPAHRVLPWAPLAVLLAGAAAPASAVGVELLEPDHLTVDASLPKEQADARILAARRYATFWSTGEEALAREALAPDFVDRTLPAGRAQGLPGPLAASKRMRAAIPDLRCQIAQLLVVGDRVVVHLRFDGHFTGVFGDTRGKGQPVAFIATDVYRVADGRIAENWHIEDNLTLLQQLGQLGQLGQ